MATKKSTTKKDFKVTSNKSETDGTISDRVDETAKPSDTDFRTDVHNRIAQIQDKNLRNILFDLNRGSAYVAPVVEEKKPA